MLRPMMTSSSLPRALMSTFFSTVWSAPVASRTATMPLMMKIIQMEDALDVRALGTCWKNCQRPMGVFSIVW